MRSRAGVCRENSYGFPDRGSCRRMRVLHLCPDRILARRTRFKAKASRDATEATLLASHAQRHRAEIESKGFQDEDTTMPVCGQNGLLRGLALLVGRNASRHVCSE